MFIEFFDWFCNSLKTVFITMDKFILFGDFSYFDFACGLLATGIIFKLLSIILDIEDEEPAFEYVAASRQTYMSQYDSDSWNQYNKKSIYWGNYKGKHVAMHRSEYPPSNYKGKHVAMYRYEYLPKHGSILKGKHSRSGLIERRKGNTK